MDSIAALTGAMVAGVPLMFVVMGLVEWIKSMGVVGKSLPVASMAIGLLLGGGYLVTQQIPPAEPAYQIYVYWFAVVIYGLAMGLVASGLYDVIKGLLARLIPPVG